MDEVVLTEDGSQSIYSQKFNALYHSIHGAIQESLHVFIEAGLKEKLKISSPSSINILEIGFGTGLNALLTLEAAEEFPNTHIRYFGIEAYPINLVQFADLNYTQIINRLDLQESYEKMHSTEMTIEGQLAPNFRFQRIECLFEKFESDEGFDIIYFDAFAPSVQPHLWEEEFLHKLYHLLKMGGILTTYGAKGSFKRALKAVGFRIQSIPGPHGKREMTRAVKE